MEKPNATFCNGKYSVSNNFCYTECLASYIYENKSSKTCEHQPNEFDDTLTENNREKCSCT